jgi:hypothetical protein
MENQTIDRTISPRQKCSPAKIDEDAWKISSKKESLIKVV